ncbi:hypothetical protein HMSP1_81 [Sinorhizobium phage HMSP1-Susan]|nr:hypothetical protein HMSP1_81 [Sinorhizobium phage HMSP1-Susan]
MYKPGMRVAMLDAWYQTPVEGTVVKVYTNGLTVDDDRGIRHYGAFDRVLCDGHDLFAPMPRHNGRIYSWVLPSNVAVR